MKRYIKSTKYTLEYDDERIQEFANLVKDYLMHITKAELKTLTEPAYGYSDGRLVVSKLANSLNSFFLGKGTNTVFKIDVNGEVRHAHGIGNNNQFQVLIVGQNPTVICGYIYITKGLYSEAYIGVKNLENQLVDGPFELHPSGYLAKNDKCIRRF